MIYFNNASTGGFKPGIVKKAITKAIQEAPISIGRTTSSYAIEGENQVYLCREFFSKYLNNGHIGRVIFTKNCTEGLNSAIFGTKLFGTEIITTVTEHNSVLRPLYKLCQDENLTLKFAKLDDDLKVSAKNVLDLVNSNTALIVMNAVSNVTGAKNQFEEVGRYLKGKIPLIVDGAQAGGHIDFDMKKDFLSCVCLAGHKGLYSMQGVGVLSLREDFDLSPIILGGSGSETFEKVPSTYPEKLEAGTLNYPAILSLYYGGKFAIENEKYHNERLKSLTNRLIGGLLNINDIKIYSKPNAYGIVSFEADGISSMELADCLSNVYEIVVRGGFHCAPLLHKSLQTDVNGLLRVSLSPFNTECEVDYFLSVLPDAISLCL